MIEPALARRLAAAVGFRNILVRDYVAVDDAIVLARLEDHSDLADFVASLVAWLANGR